MSLEPPNKKFRKSPETLEVEGICVKNKPDIEYGDMETYNSCIPWKHGSITGVVGISDEIEHNLYCELMQQFVEIQSIKNKTSSYSFSAGVSSRNCRTQINNGIVKRHTVPELIELTDDDSNIYKINNPKFCVEPFPELITSKESESSITVFYDMNENKSVSYTHLTLPTNREV